MLLNDNHRRVALCWGAALGVLLTLGLLFRFTNLDKRLYWHDEAYTSLRASGYTAGEVIAALNDGSETSAVMLLNYQRPSPEKSLVDAIKSTITGDPHHPLLYYLMSRLWMLQIGYSPAAMRSLAAVISVFALPGLYWLSVELFGSHRTALLAVALLCVSPIQVLMAREAREYSLWTVSIVLSSAALLQALRLQSRSGWALYAATLVLGFYSHLLFVFVAVAHALYTLLVARSRSSGRIPFDKSLVAYSLASLSSLLAFTPWIIVIIGGYRKISSATQWQSVHMPLRSYVTRLAPRFAAVFVDFEPFPTSVQLVFVLAVVALAGYSLYFLWRKGPEGTRQLVLLLIGTTAGALALADLLLGGFRSAVARYLIPCFIGIQLAVAYFLASRLGSVSFWKRTAWRLVTIALFSASIVSNVLIVQAESWWDKGIDHGYPQMMRSINNADGPLLIVDGYEGSHFGYLLAFGHELDPHVQVKWVDNAMDEIRGEYSDVFWYEPSAASRDAIVEGKTGSLENVVPGLLYRLTVN